MYSDVGSDWLALKQEYDETTSRLVKERKNILQKEKDDFAKMWCAAGLDLKETLEKRNIVGSKKKN